MNIDFTIPEEISILGIPYKVINKEKLKLKNEKVTGFVNISEQVIYIDPDYPIERQLKTLFHEITHAILGESGKYKLHLNEELAEIIALGFYSIFTQNKFL